MNGDLKYRLIVNVSGITFLCNHWDETGRFPNLDDLLLDLQLPVCFLLLGDYSFNSSSKTCVRWYWPSPRFMVVSPTYGWPPLSSVYVCLVQCQYHLTLVPDYDVAVLKYMIRVCWLMNRRINRDSFLFATKVRNSLYRVYSLLRHSDLAQNLSSIRVWTN